MSVVHRPEAEQGFGPGQDLRPHTHPPSTLTPSITVVPMATFGTSMFPPQYPPQLFAERPRAGATPTAPIIGRVGGCSVSLHWIILVYQ